MPANGETAYISSPANLNVEISLPLLKTSLSVPPFSFVPSIRSSVDSRSSDEQVPNKKQKILHGVLVMKNNVSIIYFFWLKKLVILLS